MSSLMIISGGAGIDFRDVEKIDYFTFPLINIDIWYSHIISLSLLCNIQTGGNFSWRIIVILGVANLAANSCSMGISEFLSSKAHREFLLSEKRREMWEFKHYKDVETNEVLKQYKIVINFNYSNKFFIIIIIYI